MPGSKAERTTQTPRRAFTSYPPQPHLSKLFRELCSLVNGVCAFSPKRMHETSASVPAPADRHQLLPEATGGVTENHTIKQNHAPWELAMASTPQFRTLPPFLHIICVWTNVYQDAPFQGRSVSGHVCACVCARACVHVIHLPLMSLV